MKEFSDHFREGRFSATVWAGNCYKFIPKLQTDVPEDGFPLHLIVDGIQCQHNDHISVMGIYQKSQFVYTLCLASRSM